MLYTISKGMSIKVGNWISSNIRHVANNLTLGLPFSKLVTKLIAATGLSTSGQEVVQPKKPLNPQAIEHIMKNKSGGKGDASSSQPSQRAAGKGTMGDLARRVEDEQMEIQGMKYWMPEKAAYDASYF